MTPKELIHHFNTIKGNLSCPIDEGFLEPRLADDDQVVIYCCSCSYKQILGTYAAEKIRDLSHTLTSS
jgi:hypothetical protein